MKTSELLIDFLKCVNLVSTSLTFVNIVIADFFVASFKRSKKYFLLLK